MSWFPINPFFFFFFSLVHPCVDLPWFSLSFCSLPPIIKRIDFPMVSPCVCVCGGSLLAQMLACVQCVNLGLVGSLSHDLDCVGSCLSERLQQCSPPRLRPARLTNKDLGHFDAPPPAHLTLQLLSTAPHTVSTVCLCSGSEWSTLMSGCWDLDIHEWRHHRLVDCENKMPAEHHSVAWGTQV